MTVKSIRILIEFTWPGGQVDRVWDGGGPFVDSTGELWQGCSLADGFDDLEMVINGEAYVMNLALTNVGAEAAALHWLSLESGGIINGVVRILIQPCDGDDQPVGASEVMFTGRVDNVIFDDSVSNDRPVSVITLEVANRFNLRKLKHGGVLSDTDQRARSAVINPLENPDKFCERIPMLEDKTVVWPRFW